MDARKNKIEDLFSAKSFCDKKHRVNTCMKPVDESILREIEKGCSLETLEKILSKKFDIYKYQTQITIHGIFPETETRRIGGYYVNLVQNKNKSIGVRYTAIDHAKKNRLFGMLQTLGKYSICENSTGFYIYDCEAVPRENPHQVIEQMKRRAENIDKSLFFGSVDCFLAQSPFGSVKVYIVVNIGCFYEINFEKLFENLSGLTFSDGVKEVERIEKENAERSEKRYNEWKAECAERAAKEADLAARKMEYMENNAPRGFAKLSDYQAKPGDVIAFAAVDSEGEIYTAYKGFAKSFGRLTSFRCDADGNRLSAGTQVYRNSFSGYVKVA